MPAWELDSKFLLISNINNLPSLHQSTFEKEIVTVDTISYNIRLSHPEAPSLYVRIGMCADVG